MPYIGWACFGGQEIFNSCRTVAYASGTTMGTCLPCVDIPGGCGCCESIHEGDIYTTPADDPAPWYDPGVPESENFHGILVTEITGLGPGEVTREITDRASGRGSILSRPKQTAPLVTVTALLLGEDCCATDFGLRWLSAMLKGSCGQQDGCVGDDLIFYSCCPDDCGSPGDSPGGSPGSPDDADPCDRYRRILKNVALVDSPTVLEQLPLNDGGSEEKCGCIYEIEFQLAAAEPCQYTEPQTVASNVEFIPDDPDGEECRFEWVIVSSGDECRESGGCPDDDPCLVDPDCPPGRTPPRPPPSTNPCVCDPWETATGCALIDADWIPDHAEGIPIITLRSGSNELRNTKVTFQPNPLQVPPDDLDPCAACAVWMISRIPPDSTFTLDGTTRTAIVECPGSAPTDVTRLLSAGAGELPFTWPIIECGDLAWSICISTDATEAAADASFDVAIVSMEC